jgi:fibronectin type 3 domain-containing protein
MKQPGRIELRIGQAVNPFQVDTWAAEAKPVGEFKIDGAVARAELPAADWAGQEIVAGVRLFSPKERQAGWSNFVSLAVVAPLQSPQSIRAEATPAGVRINWQAAPGRFRVLRRSGGSKTATPIGETNDTEYLDKTAEYGRSYQYSVEAIRNEGNVRAASERSGEVEITPQDRFAPAVPAGLSAIASTGTIELAWEQNTEPDLAGYRIYRAEGTGELAKIAEAPTAPNYSDRQVRSGVRYRYAVSSVDKAENESAQSAPVELVAP